MTDTILVLSGIGIPLYSARGLTQSLEPIDAAKQTARTVNGDLIDIGLPQFRKYKSAITCRDFRSPALNNIFPGDTVTVDCVAELSYPTSGGSPARKVVTGSSRVEGSFTHYRPQLTMRVIDFNIQRDEYGAYVGWTLELEETTATSEPEPEP